jgi:sigma-B regulation protein RsbU (phosphoserine phosphatase)
MTSVPLSRQPSSPSSGSSAEPNPVLALKELVVRLYQEQNKIQDLLSSLGFALRSFKNLNQFLELIPLMATRATHADGGALVLFKPNGQLQLERMHCHDTSGCQEIQHLVETAAREAAALNTTSMAPTQVTAMLDQQIHDCLEAKIQLFGTPILAQDCDRGRLYVFSRRPEYTWTESRQKLIRLIADQTAVAIVNDELSLALRKKENLDRELAIGAEIQEQLLPRECPFIPGIDLAAHWQPAGHVGGDYFDFIPANFDQVSLVGAGTEASGWSLVIGDVMGKGVPAGLIMTLLRGTLRAEVLNGHSPAQILQHLNQLMYLDLEHSSRFVTLFYSWYDPKTRLLSYGNAAHNPPLLWRSQSQVVQRLDAFGALIGLDAASQYQEAKIELYPGDTLIYYTDGFTDAANPKGKRFEEDQLIVHFQQACCQYESAQQVLDYLFEQVQQFIGLGNPCEDDMTLIVMRVKP